MARLCRFRTWLPPPGRGVVQHVCHLQGPPRCRSSGSSESSSEWPSHLFPEARAGPHPGTLPAVPVSPAGPSPASFLPRVKVILAPRCHLSDHTCWPSSRTSPTGPRCTSASASCWARTESRGEAVAAPAGPVDRSGRGPWGSVRQPLRQFGPQRQGPLMTSRPLISTAPGFPGTRGLARSPAGALLARHAMQGCPRKGTLWQASPL